MKFKDWLQNEIELNLDKAPIGAAAANPTQAVQATTGFARDTMAKFGPKLVQDMGSAPSRTKAGTVAVNYATKAMGQVPQPSTTPTNALAVGAQVYKQATGQDLKTMGKK